MGYVKKYVGLIIMALGILGVILFFSPQARQALKVTDPNGDKNSGFILLAFIAAAGIGFAWYKNVI